jgi:hypothetical protein
MIDQSDVAAITASNAQAATDQMKKIYHYLDKPRDLREACPHSVEGMSGHILLLGSVFFVRISRFNLSYHSENLRIMSSASEQEASMKT